MFTFFDDRTTMLGPIVCNKGHRHSANNMMKMQRIRMILQDTEQRNSCLNISFQEENSISLET